LPSPKTSMLSQASTIRLRASISVACPSISAFSHPRVQPRSKASALGVDFPRDVGPRRFERRFLAFDHLEHVEDGVGLLRHEWRLAPKLHHSARRTKCREDQWKVSHIACGISIHVHLTPRGPPNFRCPCSAFNTSLPKNGPLHWAFPLLRETQWNMMLVRWGPKLPS